MLVETIRLDYSTVGNLLMFNVYKMFNVRCFVVDVVEMFNVVFLVDAG